MELRRLNSCPAESVEAEAASGGVFARWRGRASKHQIAAALTAGGSRYRFTSRQHTGGVRHVPAMLINAGCDDTRSETGHRVSYRFSGLQQGCYNPSLGRGWKMKVQTVKGLD